MDFVTCFITLLQVLLTLFESSSSENCVQQSPCSCRTSKYSIDFSGLSKGPNPRFSGIKDPDHSDTTYSYEPCIAMRGHCGTDPGTSTAVCQIQGSGSYVVGLPDSVKISGDVDMGTLNAIYNDGRSGGRSAMVSLICGKEEKFISKGEKPQLQYNFELTSPLLCPYHGNVPGKSGISTGSVLLIIFFVLLIVYFLVGALFLKFRRGAQGAELVPNLEFWKSIPGLVKDGIVFVFRGCKTDTSYSKI